MSPTLHIDLESRSKVDLRKAGVYVYAADPSTDIWCAAYAFDDEPVQLWLPGMPPPERINDHVGSGGECVAHNANFERAMWAGVLHPDYHWTLPDVTQWRCTMAQALAMALPGSLKNATRAMGMPYGGKEDDGHALMLRMAKPRRMRKGEAPGGTYWFDDEDRKRRLGEICVKDVEDERELDRRLLALRPAELALWHLDQVINDRGVYVDKSLCDAALAVVAKATAWLNSEIYEITGTAVSKTTQVAEITDWLHGRNVHTDSLDKAAVEILLLRLDLPDDVRRVLEIRRDAAKASVSKITALLKGRNADGYARGLLQFHAAGTGRWGGRRVQPQNFKRPALDDIDAAVAAVATGSADYVRLLYGPPLAVVSDILRGLIIAKPGNKLLAADFSNIEGRIIAWLAGEKWKVQAFRDFDSGKGHDIYHLTAGKILGKAPGDITKLERQGSGKVPELALGFQGGVVAFQKMAVIYGVTVTDERAEEIKVAWRDEHPNVVQFWYDIEAAAKDAIAHRGREFTCGRIRVRCAGDFLFMRLPGGRSISYPYPCIRDKMTPWGEMRPQVSYKGVDTYTRQWTDCYAHGGLLFNNAVQGTARDIEAEAMTRLHAAGYETGDPADHGIILTVHDEVLAEVPEHFGSVEQFENIMVAVPAWAIGLPIAAGAWTAERYRK